jgi:choline dehydrogenase
MGAVGYDYIIIGGGSAGCALAGILLRRSSARVAIIEAGPRDTDPFLHMPGALPKAFRHTWGYRAEPDEAVAGRAMPVQQGFVLGGSSSVNGLIYIRGQAEDFDGWASDHGCAGWGYADLLPYFKRCERNESLSEPFHGTRGLLPVGDGRHRHPLMAAFVRAGQEMGLPFRADFNGDSQQGVGFYQLTARGGKRASAFRSYLGDLAGNPNLRIITGALVRCILIENGRATGVEYEHGGTVATARASAEVILAAGAIGSPKVLMLSGIGPSEDLRRHDIPTIAELPVGSNYQDHICVSVHAKLRESSHGLLGEDKGLNSVRHGAQWLAFKTGLLTSNILEAGAFVDTLGGDRPDVQVHAMPVIVERDPALLHLTRQNGMTLKMSQLRPESRGSVTLASADPRHLPRLRANYLHDRRDVECQIRGLRLGFEMFRAPSLNREVEAILSPHAETLDDPEQLERFVRANVNTGFHPVGTCRMGSDPAGAVVDTALRVWGVEGLRVADSSIFPTIPSGNTNAASIMVGERCADLILGTAQAAPPPCGGSGQPGTGAAMATRHE